MNYTLTTTAVTSCRASAYPIVVTLGANPNYAVTKTDALLTVNPKAGDGDRQRQEQVLRRRRTRPSTRW